MKIDPRIAIMLAAGVVLPALGVAPQLQARTLGEEYVVRVAPVDPIDPFRGAYVDLSYPDLQVPPKTEDDDDWDGMGVLDDGESGDLFITLEKRGEVWVAGDHVRERPQDGPYLACSDRDWRITCGIESLFLPQDEARAMEREVSDGGMVATVRIDGRGHAALMSVDPAD